MRILLRAPIGSTGGYQRDGIGIINALEARGHLVDLIPLSVWPPIPPNVARLLTIPISSGYDLEIHHVPPSGAELDLSQKSRARKTVLWTMWEWDDYADDEINFEYSRAMMLRYDQVVGYTQQTLDAFKKAEVLGKDQPTAVVQGGFEFATKVGDRESKIWYPVSEASEHIQQVFPDRSKLRGAPFRFAMVGVLNQRKNPFTVLYAFNELKEELGDDFNAEMIFKTAYPLLPDGYDAPGVKLIKEANWSDAQLREFYWSVDCVVNCAWGEGKDLPLMEATMCGTPILANDNEGHRGWIHPAIKKLVPATTMKADASHFGRFTSKAEVKEAMLDAYNNRARMYREAGSLATYIERRASWDYRIVKFGEAVGVPL